MSGGLAGGPAGTRTRGRRTPAGVSPRLGFLGVGWIGRDRLAAVVEAGLGTVVGIADREVSALETALELVPGAVGVGSLDELLELGVDGVVIATPSALHPEQVATALDAGCAVFCQKPLGRTEIEVRELVDHARRSDLLLGVDLSYRYTEGMRAVRELVQGGALGEVYAVELVFHNAYGPDKPWFYDPALAGGGCMIDLGIHLIDLALWVLEGERVVGVASELRGDMVEDYAIAQLRLEGGAIVRLATSWRLPAGRDAVIEASFYGSAGGASFKNVGGSFYDFSAEVYEGTRRRLLVEPPDRWGGRAIGAWVEALARGAGYDPGIEVMVEVGRTLDRIYRR